MVDVVLVALLLIFAVNGYRQGFVVGLLSFLGFFTGAVLGLQLGPRLANQFEGDSKRVLISIVTIFGLAILGQTLAGLVGARLRNAISNRTAQRFDDLGGAFVSAIAVLVVIWLVAAPLGQSSLPWLAKSIRNSAIIGTVDKVMPDQARRLSDALRSTVNTQGFPQVFDGLVPTRVREVDEPRSDLADSTAAINAERSVVKILATAQSCSRRIEGSGFVYATDRIMTNAHVVAGAKKIEVVTGGGRKSGRVVVYDSSRDLAVIYVQNLGLPVMRFAPKPAVTGADAVVVGYPLDGPYDRQAARVRDVRSITGPDIYDRDRVTREVYTIRGLVRSGNSGGPLLSTEGAVLGVIFAAAADDPQTGFAVTAAEAAPVAEEGIRQTASTSTGACA